MGDRSGGREPKGASLKKSKKNPGAPAAKTKKQPKLTLSGPSTSLPPPQPIGDELYFDCGAAILSRQFDRDRERMLLRAKTEGNCSVIISWFSDIEKQAQLAELCKINTGYCYFITGIHPDNIDGTNKKAHETWLEKTEELAKRAECVGILSGINLTRETKTHFAQEALLKSSCELAEKLLLPIVLHVPDSNSLERALEVMREIGWTDDENKDKEDENDKDNEDNEGNVEGRNIEGTRRILIHDIITSCGGNIDKIQIALHAGCYVIVSATGLTDSDPSMQRRSISCIQSIPLDKLLICSDSPWKTPQNLPDVYLRTMRNEPANIPFVMEAIASAYGTEKISIADLSRIVKSNSFKVFGMEYLDVHVEERMNSLSTIKSTEHRGMESMMMEIDNGNSISISDDNYSSNNSKGKSGGKTLRQSKSSKSSRDKEILNNVDDLLLQETMESKLKIEDSESIIMNKSIDKIMNSSYYGCQRCRLRLFKQSDIKVHGLDATRTIFKSGEQGLCQSTIFIGCIDNKQISLITGISVRGTNVQCSECGTKLGKYSVGESFCACGALVSGPTVRIQSIKVDFFDESLNTEELVARSLLEAEEAHRDALYDEEDNHNKPQKSSKRKKKIRSENKGNFSDYRNKSFKPNASRTKKSGEGDFDDNSNSSSVNDSGKTTNSNGNGNHKNEDADNENDSDADMDIDERKEEEEKVIVENNKDRNSEEDEDEEEEDDDVDDKDEEEDS